MIKRLILIILLLSATLSVSHGMGEDPNTPLNFEEIKTIKVIYFNKNAGWYTGSDGGNYYSARENDAGVLIDQKVYLLVERGERNLTLLNIYKIANFLGIKLSKLFDFE